MKDYKFQLVLSEETNFKKLLQDSYIDNTKLFFERKGKPMEGKGKQAIWYYKGAANILASQYFPMNLLETLNKDAIATRCKIIELKRPKELIKPFPVNAHQVAHWLQAKYDKVTGGDSEEEYSELDQSFEIQATQPTPMKLEQASLLGKRRNPPKTKFNSDKVQKRTKREVEWKVQKQLDFTQEDMTVEVKELEEEKEASESDYPGDSEGGEDDEDQTLQDKYNRIRPYLQYYYRGRSFPYQLIHRIYQDHFREREFCYTIIKDDKEFWKRKQSLVTPEDFKNVFTANPPYAVYSAAIFEKPALNYKTMKGVKPIATDLVFDIDIDAYDGERTCGCSGKQSVISAGLSLSSQQ